METQGTPNVPSFRHFSLPFTVRVDYATYKQRNSHDSEYQRICHITSNVNSSAQEYQDASQLEFGRIILYLGASRDLLSVGWNVIISSKVSDVRIAQQFGYLAVIPLGGIYVLGELNVVNLSVTNNLLVIAAILFVIDIILLYLTRAAFRREEILTKWK